MGDSVQETATVKEHGTVKEYDAIVIGAGVAGLYQLYRLRQAGLSVRLYEDGSGVGGTWYWNRYPGCRFDSESESYGYSWSPELLQEWDWKEHYSGQPENERYLNFVADKFDLRRDIQFNSRVTSAVYDERANRWDIQLEHGERARAQFLVTATGLLSARYTPPFEGIDSFQEWPLFERISGRGGCKGRLPSCLDAPISAAQSSLHSAHS
jgi:cation diffusion facilitator CzcD-associated flavoprotein CzcO